MKLCIKVLGLFLFFISSVSFVSADITIRNMTAYNIEIRVLHTPSIRVTPGNQTDIVLGNNVLPFAIRVLIGDEDVNGNEIVREIPVTQAMVQDGQVYGMYILDEDGETIDDLYDDEVNSGDPVFLALRPIVLNVQNVARNLLFDFEHCDDLDKKDGFDKDDSDEHDFGKDSSLEA